MDIFKRHKVLLILGNGFDLSLGLKTSYANFMESDLFKSRVKILHFPNGRLNGHDKNIHNYLTLQKGIRNWIDVEEELKKYATNQRVEYYNMQGGTHSLQNASDNTIRLSYNILCLDLQTYISQLDYSGFHEDVLSLQLYRIIAASKHCNVVTFNYTDLGKLSENETQCGISYIHGNVNNGIILGFQRFEEMASGYDYMIKSENPNYKSCHLSAKMSEADEIIVYGHSMGSTDHCYFQPFFDEQVGANAKPKRFTVFTLNKESKEQIVQQMVKLSNGQYYKFQDNTDVNVIETANNDKSVEEYLNGLKSRMRPRLLGCLFSK